MSNHITYYEDNIQYERTESNQIDEEDEEDGQCDKDDKRIEKDRNEIYQVNYMERKQSAAFFNIDGLNEYWNAPPERIKR